MVVFFYGSDSYRLKQAREEIVNRYKTKYISGMGLFCFDFSEAGDMTSLHNAFKSISFFNEHRLIVCRSVFDKRTTAETMASFIKDHDLATDPDVTLIIVESLPEKDLIACHKDLFKILSGKNSVVKIIERLEGQKLFEWIQEEFRIRNFSIRNDAARKLVDLTSNDSWTLINEIEKLAAYKKNGEVAARDIDFLVSSRADLNIFDLIDAVGARNQTRATELLYRELKTGRDPYYILTMIIYQLRNLLIIKDLKEGGTSRDEISKKIKLHPFVIRKAEQSASNFTKLDLVSTYKKLFYIDLNAKAGNININDHLFGLIIGLAAQPFSYSVPSPS